MSDIPVIDASICVPKLLLRVANVNTCVQNEHTILSVVLDD